MNDHSSNPNYNFIVQELKALKRLDLISIGKAIKITDTSYLNKSIIADKIVRHFIANSTLQFQAALQELDDLIQNPIISRKLEYLQEKWTSSSSSSTPPPPRIPVTFHCESLDSLLERIMTQQESAFSFIPFPFHSELIQIGIL